LTKPGIMVFQFPKNLISLSYGRIQGYWAWHPTLLAGVYNHAAADQINTPLRRDWANSVFM